jgi:hypothetical protein
LSDAGGAGESICDCLVQPTIYDTFTDMMISILPSRIPVVLIPLSIWACSANGEGVPSDTGAETDSAVDTIPAEGDTSDTMTSTGTSAPKLTIRRVLAVVDESASMDHCTDPDGERWTVLAAYMDELAGVEDVQFGYVGFGNGVYSLPFSDRETFLFAVEARQHREETGFASDYQGALTFVHRMLTEDIAECTADERRATHYSVWFFSDAVAEPRCYEGCDDGDRWPDSSYGVCNTDQTIPEGHYIDFAPCGDYNDLIVIFLKVQEIRLLTDEYGVGAITVDTVLLFASEETMALTGCNWFYARDENAGSNLLHKMAEAGGGNYFDPSAQDGTVTGVSVSTDVPYECDSGFAMCGTPELPLDDEKH